MKTLLLFRTALGPRTDATKTAHRRFSCRSFVPIVLVLGLIPTTAIHGAMASTDDDRKAVAALIAEYQAAVKRNDAGTMARILADEFVLVTGSGKTYTEANMLEEARRGDIYQQNDEEVQTVRLWGDPAVVTAKLWRNIRAMGSHSITSFGSVTHTYARLRDGSTYLAIRRWHSRALFSEAMKVHAGPKKQLSRSSVDEAEWHSE